MASPTQKRTRTKSRDRQEMEQKEPVSHTTQFHPDVPQNLTDEIDDHSTDLESRVIPDSKLLRVGRDMALRGAEIVDCDHLVVEGKIDGNLAGGRYLKIDASGTFKGSAVVEYADISGIFEGDLQVHNKLLLRTKGLIIGKVLYGQLEVEQGGRLQGEAQYCDAAGKNQSRSSKAGTSKTKAPIADNPKSE